MPSRASRTASWMTRSGCSAERSPSVPPSTCSSPTCTSTSARPSPTRASTAWFRRGTRGRGTEGRTRPDAGPRHADPPPPFRGVLPWLRCSRTTSSRAPRAGAATAPEPAAPLALRVVTQRVCLTVHSRSAGALSGPTPMAHDIVARRSSRGSCIALAAIAAALSAVPLRAQAPCLEASRRFARPPSRVLEAGPELAHDAFLLPVDSDEFFDELSMEQHGTTWHSPLAHLEPSPEYVDELVRALADPARRHAAACDAGILAQMPIEPNLALRLAEAIAAARDGTPGAALDFAFAAVQLALGKHVAVLGDRRVALSTDPLVRYQYTKARFAAGDAAPATEALRALLFGG